MTNQFSMTRGAPACCLALLAGSVHAQTFDFELDPTLSGLSGTIELDSVTAGTLMGDYDPVTNPAGTRTRLTGNPFLAPGPTQNDAIPTNTTISLLASPDTSSSGVFELTVAGPEATLDGLVIDLLGGALIVVPVTVSVTFDSFTTANPSFFYPSLPVDVPSDAVITSLIATQVDGPVVGTLTSPRGAIVMYDFEVPVLIETTGEVMGETFPIEPVLTTVPVRASVSIENGTARLVGAATVAINETLDTEGVELPPIEFGLPTFGTETADVVISQTLDSLSLSIGLDLVLEADGERRSDCVADFDGDGDVDLTDFGAFGAQFNRDDCSEMNPCSADFDGDGDVDLTDFGRFGMEFNRADC